MEDSNYLIHHGILGMKWGVRRFQNEDGSLTYAGRKRYGVMERYRDSKFNRYGLEYSNKKDRFNVKQYGYKNASKIKRSADPKSAEEEAKKAKQRELALKILVGVGITAGVAYAMSKHAEYNEYIIQLNALKNAKPMSEEVKNAHLQHLFRSLEKTDRELNTPAGSMDGVIPKGYKALKSIPNSYADSIRNKVCNPHKDLMSGYNCQSCSIANELRRRGIAASATSGLFYSDGGRPITDLYKVFKEPATLAILDDSISNSTNRAAALTKWVSDRYPTGSRGIIGVKVVGGGGHAMSWELDKSGKLIIADAQSGHIINDISNILSSYDVGGKGTQFTRLDHLELNPDPSAIRDMIKIGGR